jgi:hypothetical protein
LQEWWKLQRQQQQATTTRRLLQHARHAHALPPAAQFMGSLV